MLHPEHSERRSPWPSRIDGAINRKVPAARHPHHQAGNDERLNRFSLDAAMKWQLNSRPAPDLAQMDEQRFCKPKVAGSIPASAPFRTTCLSTGLCTVPSPHFAYAACFKASESLSMLF